LRRRLLGLTQGQLAEALGITFQQVQKYERGTNRVSASMLVRIARRLDTTVAALVGEESVMTAPPRLLEQLATPDAMSLLQAYSRISRSRAREAIVGLVNEMAASEEAESVAA
jgi:transcriptional regulator with XRE-family HTH domain